MNTSGSIWVLFFIACGCMFILGILVGRNTMPVRFDIADLNQKLSQLQKSVLAEEENIPDTDMTFEEMPFEFYEILRDDEIYTASENEEMPLRLIKPKYEKNPPASVHVAAATPETEQSRVQHRIREMQETSTAGQPPESSREVRRSPQQAEQSIPRQRTSVPAGEGFAIQVVSLRDFKSAETVRDKFKARGYPAYIQQAAVEGSGQWYRVRIGPYSDRAQAQKDLARLQKAGVDAIVLSNR